MTERSRFFDARASRSTAKIRRAALRIKPKRRTSCFNDLTSAGIDGAAKAGRESA
jgi:hypothetical protein